MDFSTSAIYDIDKIAEFVFGNPNDRNNEVEITEDYEYDKEQKKMIPSGRSVKEVKTSDYTGQSTIRYNIIERLMSRLDDLYDEEESLGDIIAINTLEHNGFIIDPSKDE